MYVSDHEYVVNLDPSVKTLLFGLASISMMRCGIYEDAMKEYGLGPNNEILHRVLLYRTVSWMSILAPNVSVITAGSRLTT